MVKIFDSPAMAIMPKLAKIHNTKTTDAICRNGEGKTPTNHKITQKIKISQRVIIRPLIAKKLTAKALAGP